MDFVYEKDRIRFKIGENGSEVAGALYGDARGAFQRRASGMLPRFLAASIAIRIFAFVCFCPTYSSQRAGRNAESSEVGIVGFAFVGLDIKMR